MSSCLINRGQSKSMVDKAFEASCAESDLSINQSLIFRLLNIFQMF